MAVFLLYEFCRAAFEHQLSSSILYGYDLRVGTRIEVAGSCETAENTQRVVRACAALGNLVALLTSRCDLIEKDTTVRISERLETLSETFQNAMIRRAGCCFGNRRFGSRY